MLTRYAMMKAKNNLMTLAEAAAQYEKLPVISATQYARTKAENKALKKTIEKMAKENQLLRMENVAEWEKAEARRLVDEAMDAREWETQEVKRLIEEQIEEKKNCALRRSPRLAQLAARTQT